MSKKHKRSARPTHSKIPSLKGKDQVAKSLHKPHKGRTYYARQTGGAKPFKPTKPRHGGTGRPSSKPQPIIPVSNKGNKQWLTISKQDFESAGRPFLSQRTNGKLYFKGTGRQPTPSTNTPITYTKQQFEQAGKHRKRSKSNYEKKQKRYLEQKKREQQAQQVQKEQQGTEESVTKSSEHADTIQGEIDRLGLRDDFNKWKSERPAYDDFDSELVGAIFLAEVPAQEEPTEEPTEEPQEESHESSTDWQEERRRLDEAQRKMVELEPDTAPDIGSMTLDKVYSMIDDTIKSGYGWAGKYLKQMLDETISVWGRDAVARAIGQFSQEFIAEAETIVEDSNGDTVEVALTKMQMIIEGAIPSAEDNKALMNEADKDAQYNAPV